MIVVNYKMILVKPTLLFKAADVWVKLLEFKTVQSGCIYKTYEAELESLICGNSTCFNGFLWSTELTGPQKTPLSFKRRMLHRHSTNKLLD